MSADESNFPVSLEFFKKYTYYEEVVAQILKSKSHGNAEKFRQLSESEAMKEKAVRHYYKIFYTTPAIRERHPIRFKPMPNMVKLKILQFPNAESTKSCDANSVDTAGKEQNVGPATTQSDGDILTAKDDDMQSPKSSDANRVDTAGKEQNVGPTTTQSDGDILMGEDVDMQSTKSCDANSGDTAGKEQNVGPTITQSDGDILTAEDDDMQSTKSSDANSGDTAGKEQIVGPTTTQSDGDILMAEDDDIQSTKSCDANSGDTAGKEQNVGPTTTQSDGDIFTAKDDDMQSTKNSDANCVDTAGKEQNVGPTTTQSGGDKLKVEDDDIQSTKSDVTNSIDTAGKEQHVGPTTMQSDGDKLKVEDDDMQSTKTSDAIRVDTAGKEQNVGPTTTQSDGDKLKVEDDNIHDSNFPVSLEFFKKHTYYEEIVAKVAKSKSKGNAEMLKKFSESETFKERAVQHYYSRFYATPEIRKKHPIRFKPMPTKAKIKLLQIPNAESTKSSNTKRNEQNVGPTTTLSGGDKLMVEDEDMPQTSKKNTNALSVEEQPPAKFFESALNCDQNKKNSGLQILEVICIKKANNTPCPNVTTEIHRNNSPNHANTLHMMLSNYEWFNEFRCSLLQTLQKPFDYTKMPVTIDTFKKYSIYLEPLHQILRAFCEAEVNLVDKLLNDKELCDYLLLYYYRKYFTFPNLRNIYPLELKNCPANLREKMLMFVNINEGDSNARGSSNIPNSKDERSIPSETTTSRSLEKVQENIKLVEKTKDLFSFPADRTHTLAYMLRTSFGLKQKITHTFSKMSLKEFKSVTHIYEGRQSYQDDIFLDHIYDYICKTSIWPQSVFIKLQDVLSKLLLSGLLSDQNRHNIFLLEYISPKFLHWSNLKATTNFIECVCEDYLHRTGETLDITKKMLLAETSQNYYNRCWSHECWIGQIPIINEELPINLAIGVEDSMQLITLQPQTVEENETVGVAAGNAPQLEGNTSHNDVPPTPSHHNAVLMEAESIGPESISSSFSVDNLEFNTSQNPPKMSARKQSAESLNVRNYITIPNTQDQMRALPKEAIVQNNSDPLEYNATELLESRNNNMDKLHPTDQVDVALQANPYQQSPILCLNSDGETRRNFDKDISANEVTIKTEPGQLIPLQDLKFVENSDGILECMSFEEEIPYLNDSNSFDNDAENLPSSQITFNEDEVNSKSQNTPNKLSGDIISSGSSGSPFSLAQRLPTYCHLSESHHDSSGSTQSNLPCLATQNVSEMPQETLIGMNNGLPVVGNVEIAIAPILSGIHAGAKRAVQKAQKKVSKSAKETDLAPLQERMFRPLPLYVRGHSTSSATSKENDKNTQQRRSPPVTAADNKSPARVKSMNNTGDNHMTPHGRCLRLSLDLSLNFALAATSSQTPSTLQPVGSSQHFSILQAKPLRISQELLKDSTIFNDTSFLRAADQITCNTQSISKDKYDGKYSEVPNTDSCPKITAPKFPIKHLKVIIPTSNVFGNYKLPSLRKKLLLHYKLLEFHYIDKLDPKHVSNYQFTTTNYGSKYMQATILCGDLKTKLTDSAVALLGFTAKRKLDFLTLLKDLGEFHYALNQRLVFDMEADLRKLVLFWYFHCNVPFCFAELEYDEYTFEFSECKTIKHLGMSDVPRRMPYKCLTNAIEPLILVKMEKLKKYLRNCNIK